MKILISFLTITILSLTALAATRIPAAGDSPTAAMKSDGAGTLAPGVVCEACHALEQGPALLGDSTTVYRKGDKAPSHSDSDSANGTTN